MIKERLQCRIVPRENDDLVLMNGGCCILAWRQALRQAHIMNTYEYDELFQGSSRFGIRLGLAGYHPGPHVNARMAVC